MKNRFKILAVLIVLAYALMFMGCTKELHCDFNVISQGSWEGVAKDDNLKVIAMMKFEDGVWEWTTIQGDQVETIIVEYEERVLLEGHLFIINKWTDYILVGTQTRFDCDHVYLRDWEGNAHCLDVEL